MSRNELNDRPVCRRVSVHAIQALMRQKTDSRIDEILLTIGEFLFLGIVLSKSGISLDYRVER